MSSNSRPSLWKPLCLILAFSLHPLDEWRQLQRLTKRQRSKTKGSWMPQWWCAAKTIFWTTFHIKWEMHTRLFGSKPLELRNYLFLQLSHPVTLCWIIWCDNYYLWFSPSFSPACYSQDWIVLEKLWNPFG